MRLPAGATRKWPGSSLRSPILACWFSITNPTASAPSCSARRYRSSSGSSGKHTRSSPFWWSRASPLLPIWWMRMCCRHAGSEGSSSGRPSPISVPAPANRLQPVPGSCGSSAALHLLPEVCRCLSLTRHSYRWYFRVWAAKRRACSSQPARIASASSPASIRRRNSSPPASRSIK